jgi:hypothetical protein
LSTLLLRVAVVAAEVMVAVAVLVGSVLARVYL